jgi:hypothetical protein
MPNWCTNILTVTGDGKQIEGFNTYWSPRTFNSLVPMPEDKETQKSESLACDLRAFGAPDESLDWYYWRHLHWGTKWDCSEEDVYCVIDEEEVLAFEFDTAWSPVVPLVEKVSANFPLLQFLLEYYEAGNGFAGYARFVGGRLVEDIEGSPEDFEFSNTSEE